jgi:L-aspartate oxidase
VRRGRDRLASNSLSECFVFGYRAARAGLAGPPSSTPSAPAPADVQPPARETREAVWRDAGLAREAAGLTRLLEDPHPLARLVAASALAREESRGAHLRVDYSGINPALDGYHSLIAAGCGDVTHEEWG